MAIAPEISLLLVSLPLAVSAQVPITPLGNVAVDHALHISPNAPSLRCYVTPIRPELDFALRFHTGFVMDLPLNQYRGPNHSGNIVLDVTPKSGPAAHLVSHILFPNIPATTLYGEVKGDFFVGEGTYNVEAYLVDDSHRVCREHWQIRARRNPGERRIDLAIPPLTVAPSSSPPSAAPVARPRQLEDLTITILLHAASVAPEAAKLHPADVSMLTGSLSSILAYLPAQTVTLVIFNLDQRTVLFRKEHFTGSGLDAVAEVLRQAQFDLVDYSVLRRPGGGAALLACLARQALRDPGDDSALIFLGPHVQFQDPVLARFADRSRGRLRTFYLQYRPPVTLVKSPLEPAAIADAVYQPDPLVYLSPSEEDALSPRDAPDSIEQVVKSLKGEVLVMRRPSDLAGAIKHIWSRLSQ